jgi:RNA polymerase sigma factor (TIGR02999 family)
VQQEQNPEAITRLLVDWRGGDKAALDQLTPLVHGELRRLAAGYLRRERADHTLQPTALVNELYMQLASMAKLEWRDRAHFLGIAAYLMRQILVQHARGHRAAKRGGGARKLGLDEALTVSEDGSEEVVRLDDALRELAKWDERKSRIVEMHYFGGLKAEEMAEVLGVSVTTIGRDLRMAHAWLLRELSRGGSSGQQEAEEA